MPWMPEVFTAPIAAPTAVCSAVGPIQTATGIRTDAYRVAKMLGCGDT